MRKYWAWDTLRFVAFYWQAFFIVLVPLLLLPIFLMDDTPAKRCFYVVCVMALFWMFEVLPLGVTGMIPVVLFPLMGISSSAKTCESYMKETNVLFIGGIFIAFAIEKCNLHTRIALITIYIVGCSPRRLNFGLMIITSFVSMWIVNTAATAMMIPIIQAILEQLEEQGFGQMYETRPEPGPDEDPLPPIKEDENRRPTALTKCMFISTAYAASIGGIGTLVGTGTNLTFKGIYESNYPLDKRGMSFLMWMSLCFPLAILLTLVAIIYLQMVYLGLFIPGSKAAKAIKEANKGKAAAKEVIREKLRDLGRMSFHEIMVLLIFLLAVCLWTTRSPQVFKGWAQVLSDVTIKDSAAAIFSIVLMFMIPATPTFIRFCSKDPERRPKTASDPLVTWKYLSDKMPWGLVFLLGGGFAISDGAQKTGMSDMVANWLGFLSAFSQTGALFMLTFFVIVGTQIISSNVAVCNIFMPILSSISKLYEIHPLYIMTPAAAACSMAFSLAISTPPNAIASEPCNMRSKDLLKVGPLLALIMGLLISIWFATYANWLYDMSEYPKFAQDL